MLAQLEKGEIPEGLEERPRETEVVPEGSLNVNYFQEGEGGEMMKLRDSEHFAELNSGLDGDVETAIGDLEKKMVETILMLKRMESAGDKERADIMKQFFKKTLRDHYKVKLGPETEAFAALHIPGFSRPRHRLVANLNRFLARDSGVKGGEPKHKDIVDCWKYYSSARKSLAGSWGSVPKGVWDYLWMVLSWEGPENPHRMSHIYVLAKDMAAAGVALRESQQLLAIEAMFIEGWRDEAIEAWKKGVVTLTTTPDLFKSYHELGVRMLSLHGDTDRAQRAAETLLKSAGPPNIRILIPVIRALALKEEKSEEAWDTYQNMRQMLGDTIKIEDYDEVIAAFLATNRVEYALQAFVDMMFSSALDVRGKTKLPMAVSNQFFVGKWLKRLIGAGDLDGAYKVIVFLQGKGITASPIQVNGLIGAWLRSETAEGIEKAEDLAWNMIRARLNFVHLRHRQRSMEVPVKFYDPCGPKPRRSAADGEPPFHCASKATAETFSLLAENYCSRNLHKSLEELWGAFQYSEIKTTSFLMNQVLRSYTQSGEPNKALNLYRKMTQEQNVSPDAHSFIALFNTLSVNLLGTRSQATMEQDTALARLHFREMIDRKWAFDSPDAYHLLPRTILFSMLKAKDYPGMIIAVRAMNLLFDYTPPEPLLIELASGTMTLRVKSQRNAGRIMEGAQLIESLIKRSRVQLHEAGLDIEKLPKEVIEAERRHVLENLVLAKAKSIELRPEELEPLLQGAARDMGVYDVVFSEDLDKIAEYRKVDARERDQEA
jgi:pentatricopeptide repeat protein